MTFPVLMTDYYQNFSCTGGDCLYTCCQNWSVNFSRADYNKIRSAKKGKELEAKLKEGMKRHKQSEDDNYAFFTMNKHQCAMLRADGLCELQAECGAQTLPLVCRAFPRNLGIVNTMLLRACTAGCPEIMRQLMLREQPLGFIAEEETVTKREKSNFTLKQQDHPLVRHYDKVLEVCVDILQNRAVALRERSIALGMALSALEKIEQSEKQMDVQEKLFLDWQKQYAALKNAAIGLERADTSKTVMSNLLLTQRLQQTDPAFEEVQRRVVATLGMSHKVEVEKEKAGEQAYPVKHQFHYDREAYAQARKALYEAYDLDAMLENIMVNYFFATGMPFAGETIWQSYLYFCQMYSYLQFIAIGCYGEHKSLDKLVCDLTVCYRLLAHNTSMKKTMVQHMQENDCSTLAHMAILVSG